MNAMQSRTGFFVGRLGSLLAILPLGVWTLFHLWNNLAAFDNDSGAHWQEAVTGHASRASAALVSVVVVLPLVLHALWGVRRMFASRPSVAQRSLSNVRYWVQRLSAVGLLAFLGAHLWLAWLHPRFVEGHAEDFADLAHEMRFNAPTTVVYVLGILAIAYHLANGVWSFSMGWGLAQSQRALARLEKFALVFFVALLALGWSAVAALYLAGR